MNLENPLITRCCEIFGYFHRWPVEGLVWISCSERHAYEFLFSYPSHVINEEWTSSRVNVYPIPPSFVFQSHHLNTMPRIRIKYTDETCTMTHSSRPKGNRDVALGHIFWRNLHITANIHLWEIISWTNGRTKDAVTVNDVVILRKIFYNYRILERPCRIEEKTCE